MITNIAIQEFKEILKEDYGRIVSDKVANKLANDFLASFEAILKNQPLTKNNKRRKSGY